MRAGCSKNSLQGRFTAKAKVKVPFLWVSRDSGERVEGERWDKRLITSFKTHSGLTNPQGHTHCVGLQVRTRLGEHSRSQRGTPGNHHHFSPHFSPCSFISTSGTHSCFYQPSQSCVSVRLPSFLLSLSFRLTPRSWAFMRLAWWHETTVSRKVFLRKAWGLKYLLNNEESMWRWRMWHFLQIFFSIFQ